LSQDRDPKQNTNADRRERLKRQKADIVDMLCGSWDRSCGRGTTEWTLAAMYHRGLISRIRSIKRHKNAPMRLKKGWIEAFLAMEKHCDGIAVPDTFRRFVATCAALASDSEEELRKKVVERYPYVLHAAAEQTAKDFREDQSEEDLVRMLQRKNFPLQRLVTEGLGSVWSVWYVPQAIQSSLRLLLALNPKDEYPEARAMKRHFILHIGGTNTGKTFEGFKRLKRAKTGVYLAPLRLLAVEAQETLLDGGVNCSLTTGEEEDVRKGDTHVAATAEKLDLKARYDVAVIDECQMIEDPQRGYAWTRAILGVLAPEVHLCAAPQARDILIRLIKSCGDSFEIVHHKRKTPLVFINRAIDFEHLQPGDALISFSKVGVLSAAEDLRRQGRDPAIIYGALPYATRRMQMEGFLDRQTEYIVATDAIGMGLNLPIRRIIFMETEKFDGTERRDLKPEEIQQIAGRAGRFGMYDKGYVGALKDPELIRAGLTGAVPQIEYAVQGFSDMVLKVDFDLLEVLTQWSRMPALPSYRKLDVSRYIKIISAMRKRGFSLPKETELKAANIPFDENEGPLEELFFDYLRSFADGDEIEQPVLETSDATTLPELELYCRKLDLYFSFARAFGAAVDLEGISEARAKAAEDINEILLYRLQNNIRFCESCGRPLLLHSKGRLCETCFRREYRRKHKG